MAITVNLSAQELDKEFAKRLIDVITPVRDKHLLEKENLLDLIIKISELNEPVYINIKDEEVLYDDLMVLIITDQAIAYESQILLFKLAYKPGYSMEEFLSDDNRLKDKLARAQSIRAQYPAIFTK